MVFAQGDWAGRNPIILFPAVEICHFGIQRRFEWAHFLFLFPELLWDMNVNNR